MYPWNQSSGWILAGLALAAIAALPAEAQYRGGGGLSSDFGRPGYGGSQYGGSLHGGAGGPNGNRLGYGDYNYNRLGFNGPGYDGFRYVGPGLSGFRYVGPGVVGAEVRGFGYTGVAYGTSGLGWGLAHPNYNLRTYGNGLGLGYGYATYGIGGYYPGISPGITSNYARVSGLGGYRSAAAVAGATTRRPMNAPGRYATPATMPSAGRVSSNSDLRPGMVLPDGAIVVSVGPLRNVEPAREASRGPQEQIPVPPQQ